MEKRTLATATFVYLGDHITTSDIRPLTSKVEARQRLKLPKTLKQLRSLLGLVYYYRDMWKRRLHILSPLSDLTKVPRGTNRSIRERPKTKR